MYVSVCLIQDQCWFLGRCIKKYSDCLAHRIFKPPICLIFTDLQIWGNIQRRLLVPGTFWSNRSFTFEASINLNRWFKIDDRYFFINCLFLLRHCQRRLPVRISVLKILSKLKHWWHVKKFKSRTEWSGEEKHLNVKMPEHCIASSSCLDDPHLQVFVSFYFHQCELSFVFRLGQNQTVLNLWTFSFHTNLLNDTWAVRWLKSSLKRNLWNKSHSEELNQLSDFRERWQMQVFNTVELQILRFCSFLLFLFLPFFLVVCVGLSSVAGRFQKCFPELE